MVSDCLHFPSGSIIVVESTSSPLNYEHDFQKQHHAVTVIPLYPLEMCHVSHSMNLCYYPPAVIAISRHAYPVELCCTLRPLHLC